MQQTLLRFRSMAAIAGSAILFAAAAAYADPPPPPDLNPIIFVHGGSGSAAQFETPGVALRQQRLSARDDPRARVRLLADQRASCPRCTPSSTR